MRRNQYRPLSFPGLLRFMFGVPAGIGRIGFLGRGAASAAAVALGVRNAVRGTTTSGTTTVNLPTRQAGDTLLVFASGPGTNIPGSTNTGWTRRQNVTMTDLTTVVNLYTRQSDGTDNTPFGANALGNVFYTAISIQGVVSGYDNSSNATSAAGTSIVAATLNVGGTPAILLNCYCTQDGNSVLGVAGGQTAIQQINDGITAGAHRVGYESLAATGLTGTRTGSQSSAGFPWAAISVSVF